MDPISYNIVIFLTLSLNAITIAVVQLLIEKQLLDFKIKRVGKYYFCSYQTPHDWIYVCYTLTNLLLKIYIIAQISVIEIIILSLIAQYKLRLFYTTFLDTFRCSEIKNIVNLAIIFSVCFLISSHSYIPQECKRLGPFFTFLYFIKFTTLHIGIRWLRLMTNDRSCEKHPQSINSVQYNYYIIKFQCTDNDDNILV